MSRWTYIVSPTHDGWQVVLGGKSFGPYASRACATRVAINAAEAAARKGHAADVLLRDGHREWTEWSGGSASLKPTG